MQKKILITGPAYSVSGYGKMCRLALNALKTREDIFDIYIKPNNWGRTSWITKDSEEFKKIISK